MNWKNRLTNYNFWVSIVSAVLLILQALKIKVDFIYVNEVSTAILGLLVVIGIINDPTKSTKTSVKKAEQTNTNENINQTILDSATSKGTPILADDKILTDDKIDEKNLEIAKIDAKTAKNDKNSDEISKNLENFSEMEEKLEQTKKPVEVEKIDETDAPISKDESIIKKANEVPTDNQNESVDVTIQTDLSPVEIEPKTFNIVN